MVREPQVLASINDAMRIMSATPSSKSANHIHAVLMAAKECILRMTREKSRALTTRDTVALALLPSLMGGDFAAEAMMSRAFELADVFMTAKQEEDL